MVNKVESLPDNMTIEEASEFWSTHSVADYPSYIVEMDYSEDEHITFITISNDLKSQLEIRAKKRGISIDNLINLWIKEKLSA